VTTVRELGEFGLLAELERRGLAQGIDHDAAAFGRLVITQDALIEGVQSYGSVRLARAAAGLRAR
jgi:hypothetical protein